MFWVNRMQTVWGKSTGGVPPVTLGAAQLYSCLTAALALCLVTLLGFLPFAFWSDTTTRPPCTNSEFTCHDGNCISSAFVCDSVPDCPDKSDEGNCPGLCADEDFRCEDGSCVSSTKRCDGNHDCRDGSDEIHCGAADDRHHHTGRQGRGGFLGTFTFYNCHHWCLGIKLRVLLIAGLNNKAIFVGVTRTPPPSPHHLQYCIAELTN
ncbi:hypothetical protein RUM43_014388 [Polyplax serrata]|uniref:Uncharacterized protein n=1 Tax=Polyplax serrata TaxID=468196 RepID=A0AAN8NQG0_POLSC